MKITSILDAAEFVLKEVGFPEAPYWKSLQMHEGRLWRASQHDVRAELDMDISENGAKSRFVKTEDGEYGLKAWGI